MWVEGQCIVVGLTLRQAAIVVCNIYASTSYSGSLWAESSNILGVKQHIFIRKTNKQM